MTDNPVKSVIEAILFASDKPVTAEQIRRVCDMAQNAEVRSIIEELRIEYAQAGRGMAIVEIAGGYQMVTAAQFSPFLKKFFRERHSEKLSKPALETLAIIAYKQPLTRQEIQSLRNVNVDGVIKTLVEKSLIRITGRKKVPGRPHVYGTTRQFLQYFGLKSLEELPRLEELQLPEITIEPAEIELEPAQTEENDNAQRAA